MTMPWITKPIFGAITYCAGRRNISIDRSALRRMLGCSKKALAILEAGHWADPPANAPPWALIHLTHAQCHAFADWAGCSWHTLAGANLHSVQRGMAAFDADPERGKR